jgi:glutamate/tyrosine decarboxylase-like PLP-dependent enzyme
MANFACLAAARHALLAGQGWNVESLGLFGAPPVQVIVSEEVHIWVCKALGMLGLGRDRVLTVPTDSQGRQRVELIPKINGPTILCIPAGNVNSGSFDPSKDICAAVPKEHTWVHVDGAFGLWAACSPKYAHLLDGFSDADSWATDGHKWLNLPYDCGILFVRNAVALHRAMSLDAAYLQTASPSNGVRRCRGVPVASIPGQRSRLWEGLASRR